MSARTLTEHEPAANGSTAVAAPPAGSPASVGACCEKCHAPLGGGSTSICKKCGWYAIAKVYVEIDRTWDDDSEDEPAPRADKLPAWAWVAFASVVVVIIESALVRKYTPEGSAIRTIWSGSQLLAGLLAFFGAQIVGFVILMRSDATASLLDVVLKPFKVSAMLFRELPRRFWIVNAGICGAVAALASIVIIGSVPYHLLWSWNVDYKSSQHLEDALNRELSPGGASQAQIEDKNRQKISCVIIGYELSEAGNIRVVLLAREAQGKLAYAGGVAPTGDSALLFELRENLMAIPASQPVLPMTFNSNWVLPKYVCDISYGLEQDNKKLTDLRWEGGVREMRMSGE